MSQIREDTIFFRFSYDFESEFSLLFLQQRHILVEVESFAQFFKIYKNLKIATRQLKSFKKPKSLIMCKMTF